MARGLDHIVHAVRDLDAAAAFYRRCGFQVGARNRHPWGTHNHIVQLPGFFIEILTVAEPERLDDSAFAGFAAQFGRVNQTAIERADGFSFLILESQDIDTDVAAFAASGIGCSNAQEFSRLATMPDGSSTTVGFSLCFARDLLAKASGFAVCAQHNPDAFWNGAYQQHANGAIAVLGAIFVSDNPAAHRSFLSAFAGVPESYENDGVVTMITPRGDIQLMSPSGFADRFGVTPDLRGAVLQLTALRVAVENAGQTGAYLRDAGIPVLSEPNAAIVPPSDACGATLIFESPVRA